MIQGEQPELMHVEPATLITIEPKSIQQVFTEPGVIDPLLAKIEEEVRKFKGDLTTAAGREAIASLAYKVARTKTYLDKLGKDLVDGMKELPKKVDATRKTTRERLDALRDEVRKPLDDWEANQASMAAMLDSIRARPANFLERTVEQYDEHLVMLGRTVLDPDQWGDLYQPGCRAVLDAQLDFQVLRGQRVIYDQEQAELETLRREKADREAAQAAADQAAEIAREAAEKATRDAAAAAQAEIDAAAQAQRDAEAATARAEQAQRDAEQAQKDAEAAAEQERIAAAAREERARLDGIAAEQERQRKEKEALDAEQKKRDEDTEHRRTFNREAWTDLQALILAHPKPDDAEGLALAILTAIVNRKINHVSISY